MLTIPLSYDAAARTVSAAEDCIGTVIDEGSVAFIVSGLPPETEEARMEFLIPMRDKRERTVHPYIRLSLEGAADEDKTGHATLPNVILANASRDGHLKVQLRIFELYMDYASQNMVDFKVAPAVGATMQVDNVSLERFFEDAQRVDIPEEGRSYIALKRHSGEIVEVPLDWLMPWERISDVPIVTEWSKEPSDDNIPSEALVAGTKADLLHPIPIWNKDMTYDRGSMVIAAAELEASIYLSLLPDNRGHDPKSETLWWTVISGGGGGKGGGGKAFRAIIGDGKTRTFKVTHRLGTYNISATLSDTETGEIVLADIAMDTLESARITFAEPPKTAGIRVTMMSGSVQAESLTYVQTEPASEWVVKHNLDRRVSVQLWTPEGEQMIAEVRQPDLQTVVVSLGEPLTGTVTIN